jgi:hypothetical protein
VNYINLKDFDPSKEPYAVVDQDVADAVRLCLEANERGEVKTFSADVSIERIKQVVDRIEKLASLYNTPLYSKSVEHPFRK